MCQKLRKNLGDDIAKTIKARRDERIESKFLTREKLELAKIEKFIAKGSKKNYKFVSDEQKAAARAAKTLANKLSSLSDRLEAASKDRRSKEKSLAALSAKSDRALAALTDKYPQVGAAVDGFISDIKQTVESANAVTGALAKEQKLNDQLEALRNNTAATNTNTKVIAANTVVGGSKDKNEVLAAVESAKKAEGEISGDQIGQTIHELLENTALSTAEIKDLVANVQTVDPRQSGGGFTRADEDPRAAQLRFITSPALPEDASSQIFLNVAALKQLSSAIGVLPQEMSDALARWHISSTIGPGSGVPEVAGVGSGVGVGSIAPDLPPHLQQAVEVLAKNLRKSGKELAISSSKIVDLDERKARVAEGVVRANKGLKVETEELISANSKYGKQLKLATKDLGLSSKEVVDDAHDVAMEWDSIQPLDMDKLLGDNVDDMFGGIFDNVKKNTKFKGLDKGLKETLGSAFKGIAKETSGTGLGDVHWPFC